jgi:hypothetical protein
MSVIVSPLIEEMKKLLAEAEERKAAWPPTFIESSLCPENKFIVLSHKMFEDNTWRVMFNPENRAQVKQMLNALPKSRMRKVSKKDALHVPKVRIHFEGEYRV